MLKRTTPKRNYFKSIATLVCGLTLFSCSDDSSAPAEPATADPGTAEPAAETSAAESPANSAYAGTASVSQGPATITTPNLLDCRRGRNAPVGTSTASDGTTWTVPAVVNFGEDDFPTASDLHNPCSGVRYDSGAEALAALDGSDIIEVDSDGEVITAYVFADNYFEMYINGTPVGKDNVPFTQFNSNVVRFRANRPFTIAMKLVDWEENSGLGSENNRGRAYHPGDGGMVAVFVNASGTTVATTGAEWKAQTFYTAPIADLRCATEDGSSRLSTNCSTEGTDDGSALFALHWAVPDGWQAAEFDDSSWPSATTYANEVIGVDNKSSYTSFTDIFDDSEDDAEFIWSTNVVLDNEVLVRHTVR